MDNATDTETLTDTVIRKLRTEAEAAGDLDMVGFCDAAEHGDAEARAECATAITNARAMNDDQPLVRVVA